MSPSLSRRLTAEALGSALLLCVVVGSGIMGERLGGGIEGLALLGNTLATGAALVVLITVLGPLSGAHFNPVVTLAFVVRGQLPWWSAALYVPVQIGAAIVGVFLAHAMFSEPIFQISTTLREGSGQALSEAVATFGLILTIFGTLDRRPDFTPMAVGLYIAAAYWFTASTSFANPAVTIARGLSNSFAGIAPGSVPLFVGMQFIGGLAACVVCSWLFRQKAC